MTARDASPNAATTTTIHFALYWLLRRVVRLALTFGVTFPTMEALLKRCYVESARNDFPLPGTVQTSSRIALLTGLNRSDLRRLQDRTLPDAPLPTSMEWRVSQRWGEPPFVDGTGRLASLPRLASVGGAVSFESLVAMVSTDIHPASLLSQWVATGVVQVNDEDWVTCDFERLNHRLGLQEEPACALAFVVGDLIQGHIDNMPDPPERRLRVQAAWVTDLSPGSVRTLNEATQKIFDEIGQLHALAIELKAADAGRDDALYRYMVCSYRYWANAQQDPGMPLTGDGPAREGAAASSVTKRRVAARKTSATRR